MRSTPLGPSLPRLALVCAAVALFSGCSSYSLSTPKSPPLPVFGPPPSPSVGEVCVIRPSHWALGVTFAVHDDGHLVGATRGESYFCYLAAPGDHQIVSDTGDDVDEAGHANLHVDRGHTYYLHQDFDNVFGSIRSKLEWVEESRAHELIEGCDYKTIVGVPGDERLPSTVPVVSALAPAKP